MPKTPSQTLQQLPVVGNAELAKARATRLELELEAVMQFGTPEQRTAYRACTLDDEEILVIVRRELFRPFDQFSRWQKINAKEVHHKQGCPLSDKPELVRFETCDLDPAGLNQYAWDTLGAIRTAANVANKHPWLVRSTGMTLGVVLIEPLTHWAMCSKCQAEISRSSAKVSMVWADRTLTREYAL